MLHVCVSACICVTMSSGFLSLSCCHRDILDGQAKDFCHCASPSPARPSSSANLLFLPPVTSLSLSLSLPNTPFPFRLLPHTDSIFLARLRTSPAQLIKLMHSYLDETIGFTPHRNSRSAGVLISMLEAIKGVTFPLL